MTIFVLTFIVVYLNPINRYKVLSMYGADL